jgi:hypothetical protein
MNEASRKKMSESAKRKFENNPSLKEKISKEQTERMKDPVHLAKLKGTYSSPAYHQRKRNATLKKNREDPEYRAKQIAANRKKAEDPEFCKKLSRKVKEKYDNDFDWTVRRLESLIGGLWYGCVRYYDYPIYCEKFTLEFKERVRAYWNYTCAGCEKLQSDNNGKRLSIHHVHYDKQMCCNGSLKDVVPLCSDCHNKTLVGKNKPMWERKFTDIIYSPPHNGKCYFTKEEMLTFKINQDNKNY